MAKDPSTTPGVNAAMAVEQASTTEGLPVAVSMGPALASADMPLQSALVDRRVLLLCVLSLGLAVAAAYIARVLVYLIGLITSISFYGRLPAPTSSGVPVSPAENHLGLLVIAVPVIGGIIVGLMARYGSKAIRGHGIPEAMEQVLLNESRVPARLTFLKPLSAAIAIGTGGPFGAEGPIIATGAALGSLIGQVIRTTAAERKTLLAAGAAAGMAATFGSPVSAVLLAVELLLFEYRPRSIIPVALASAGAAAMRIAFAGGVAPMFAMPDIVRPAGVALWAYIVLGAIVGVASVFVTRVVYAVEHYFEHLPIHWMWWPALGAVAVGVCGWLEPRTLGVGYYNISDLLSYSGSKLGNGSVHAPLGTSLVGLIALLCIVKFISWSISLGSGTSGGTLAPLFTIGAGLGALLGVGAAHFIPGAGVDVRIAALVGMAAMFAGASRALLTSVVFAFETTLQPLGLLPLLGGCSASFLVSCLLMRHTIMTEKIARRGVLVPAEYHADFLAGVLARDAVSERPVTLRADQTVGEARRWIESGAPGSGFGGFPIVDGDGAPAGVAMRRRLFDPAVPPERRLGDLHPEPARFIHPDSSLREAADVMVEHELSLLPVVERGGRRVIGVLTLADILSANRRRLRESRELSPRRGKATKTLPVAP